MSMRTVSTKAEHYKLHKDRIYCTAIVLDLIYYAEGPNKLVPQYISDSVGSGLTGPLRPCTLSTSMGATLSLSDEDLPA